MSSHPTSCAVLLFPLWDALDWELQWEVTTQVSNMTTVHHHWELQWEVTTQVLNMTTFYIRGASTQTPLHQFGSDLVSTETDVVSCNSMCSNLGSHSAYRYHLRSHSAYRYHLGSHSALGSHPAYRWYRLTRQTQMPGTRTLAWCFSM